MVKMLFCVGCVVIVVYLLLCVVVVIMRSMAKFTDAWRMMAGCLVVVAESKDGGCVVVLLSWLGYGCCVDVVDVLGCKGHGVVVGRRRGCRVVVE